MKTNRDWEALGITILDPLQMEEYSHHGDTITITWKKQSNPHLTIHSFPKEMNLEMCVEKDAHLKLELLAFDQEINGKIHIKLKENANLEAAMADFSSSNELHVLVDLEERFAQATWHLACISHQEEKKVFNINFQHFCGDTSSTMNNWGVLEDASFMRFCGVSWILHGAKKAKAHQQAKMMVFDEKCHAIANPILKIDENDIEASHACAVGKVSDEQMFYLTSRGIPELEAKQLITLGYIQPIIAHFDSEETRKQIIQEIERGLK